MRLGLSSAAAPDASLDELLAACRRRGLAALELEASHGHGLDPDAGDTDAAVRARRRAADAGIALAGFRLATPLPIPASPAIDAMARYARALGAPLMVPAPTRSTDAVAVATSLQAAGAEVRVALPAAGGDAGSALPMAWDADPALGDLAGAARDLLAAAGPRLRHIRLLGGGPEAAAQEGQGIGALMARLALAGYGGVLVLAPSSPRYRVVWDAWLGRRGGWGCGSRDEDRDLVRLGAS